MFRFIALLCLIAGCSNRIHENAAIFNYGDFGSQVIASEAIGMEWWQWQLHGDSRPKKYDVKVVVYRNVSLGYVKNLYPVISEQNKDYRYLEYDAALIYLDGKIEENIIEEVTELLKNTRERIVTKLGDKG